MTGPNAHPQDEQLVVVAPAGGGFHADIAA
jgi:hypothetical protein